MLLAGRLVAQAPVPPPTPEPEPPHKGQIIIQSHGEPPSASSAPEGTQVPQAAQAAPVPDAKVDVSDEQREALTVSGYDLDLRLNLQRSTLESRARLEVRNDGKTPLKQLALQLSSTLRWEGASLTADGRRNPLTLAQHRLDTDADHTGAATEAVLSLPEPLAPGAITSLDVFYSGTLGQNGDRLGRLGASSSQQRQADWDGIGPDWTGMRGFGDVLWYPVSSPQLFLADGNTLFTAIGRMRQREQGARVHLRLSVEYAGEPPVAAYFCGRRAALKAAADDPSVAIASGTGIATAEFPAEPLGFRTLNLFVIQQPETMVGVGATASEPIKPASSEGQSSSSSSSSSHPGADGAAPPAPEPTTSVTGEPVLALVSSDASIAPGLGTAADRASSLLADWLGVHPLTALTVIDHTGQPFQDGPVLVAPAATLETSPEMPAMVYSLSHAWVQTGQPWMDEGLAQFFALLWVERENGREAALNQLAGLMQPVAPVEPELTSSADTKPGQPIISATDELFYRRKAAAVWWMLRDQAGEKALHTALATMRTQPASQDSAEKQARAFQHLLERLSGKDLGWFFDDWVLRDRGLPDLSIADVQTARTPAGPGHNTGFLVAITVRNEGAATADVPLIVRSGQFSATQRVRVPGFSQATQRVLVEAPPTEVQVNDGSTPESRAVVHKRQLEAKPQQ